VPTGPVTADGGRPALVAVDLPSLLQLLRLDAHHARLVVGLQLLERHLHVVAADAPHAAARHDGVGHLVLLHVHREVVHAADALVPAITNGLTDQAVRTEDALLPSLRAGVALLVLGRALVIAPLLVLGLGRALVVATLLVLCRRLVVATLLVASRRLALALLVRTLVVPVGRPLGFLLLALLTRLSVLLSSLLRPNRHRQHEGGRESWCKAVLQAHVFILLLFVMRSTGSGIRKTDARVDRDVSETRGGRAVLLRTDRR
jgi:hypothetical protein